MRILKEKIIRYEDHHNRVKAMDQGELIRCKDCRYFETDLWEEINGIPLIVAHEMCTRWGRGCKTRENGYCFLAERREE